jgi:hypothetical protein
MAKGPGLVILAERERDLGKGTSRWWFLQCLALPDGLVVPQGAGMEQVAEGREV